MGRVMKDSGIEWIGEIPEGWDCVKLKYMANLKTGTTPSSTQMQYFEGDFNWYTPGDFTEDIILKESSRKLHSTVISDNQVPLFPANSILIIGIGATTGKIGYTNFESSSNQQITAIMPKTNIQSKYLMYWLISIVDFIKGTTLFTTLPILNNQALGSVLCLQPQLA
ncbi:MAG: restriction endonuclease subunit S [Firmicutes bacterium]|nr:restriction endonuclease subunit S [Bacillota bacterium]